MTLFETLRNVLPRSLFTHLGEPPRAIEVPHRIAELIRAREEESERLIGWVQLVMAATFAALYVIAPRPLDAGMSVLAPVPLALTGYAAFTAARLVALPSTAACSTRALDRSVSSGRSIL